jgi:hypothetical protein
MDILPVDRMPLLAGLATREWSPLPLRTYASFLSTALRILTNIQQYARASGDKIIEGKVHLSPEQSAGHSYIDMIRSFRRSNGKVH